MNTSIEDKEQKCLECGITCSNRRSLGNHLARSHKNLGGQQGYVIKHFLNGTVPLCKCGCGKNVEWHKLLYKFNDYLNGHNVSNLSGFKLTPEQIEKRNNSIRKTYQDKREELSQRISKSVSDAFKDETKNRNLREGQRRGWKDDTDRKSALSLRNVDMIAQGLIGPQAPFKREWKLNPWTKQEEYMHSSWETAFMDACISRSYPVTKNHGIVIPYTHPDGTTRNYIPDFYATEDRTLYEVKGRHDEVDDAKWSAAAEWCRKNGMSFQCIFEDVTGSSL